MHSAAREDLKTTKVLQKTGADIHARKKAGHTVSQVAANNKQY